MAQYPLRPHPEFSGYGRKRLFNTLVTPMESGTEQRRKKWGSGKQGFSLGYQNLTLEEFERIRDFFLSMEGRANAFTFIPPHVVNQAIAPRTFAAAEWVKPTVDEVVYSDFETAPNLDGTVGATTADTIQVVASGGGTDFLNQTVSYTIAGGEYFVFSFFGRQGALNNNNVRVKIVTDAPETFTTDVTLSATELTRNWFVASPTLPATTITVSISPMHTAATSNCYVWGAQLEETSVSQQFPSGYEKTTAAAGLINQLLYSEELENAAWVEESNVTVFENTLASPHELADLVHVSSIPNTVYQTFVSDGGVITAAIYAKKWAGDGITDPADQLFITLYDQTNGNSVANTTAELTDAWQRIEISTADLSVGGGDEADRGVELRLRLFPTSLSANDNRCLLWGVQLEYSAAATSFRDDYEAITARFDTDTLDSNQSHFDTFNLTVPLVQVF